MQITVRQDEQTGNAYRVREISAEFLLLNEEDD